MLARIKPYIPIFLLTAGHGAVDSYLGFMPVLVPMVASTLQIPMGDVVMLVGITALVNNLSQPLIGYIIGRKNLSWTLWFAIALSSLPVFMGYTTGFWSLAILSVLGGIGTGLYHPEGLLATHDAAGDKAYLGIPLFMAGGAAIYAMATPLSIRLTESFGLKALVIFLVPGLLLSAIFFAQYRKRKREHPSIVIRPRSKRMTQLRAGGISFWPLLAVSVCFCVASGLFLSVLSSHYELLFGPDARSWSGWVLMVMGVGASLSSFMWSALSKRIGFYLLAFLTQIVAVPLFVLMANPTTPEWGLVLAIPLCLVTPAAIHPVGVALSHNAAGSTKGLRASLMVGGTYAVTSLAIMLAGVLLRRGMPSGDIILFVAGCSLLALLLAGWQLVVARKNGSKGDRRF